MKREFLMLAQTFDPKKHSPCGMYMSEKLDGVRAFWDGGISRGIPCTAVPYANVEKHGRYKQAMMATGLWTRYGQAIQASETWLNSLPGFPLDGELTMGRCKFQATLSCVRSLEPDSRWNTVQYKIFDVPAYETVFADGRITNTNFKKTFDGIPHWAYDRLTTTDRCNPSKMPFFQVLGYLRDNLPDHGPTQLHEQFLLPSTKTAAEGELSRRMDWILQSGGEGIMLRLPTSYWRPERAYSLLKVKGMQDAEGTVIGYKWGKETDKGSKLLGMMGSLRLRMDSGKEFDLSGFTESERTMSKGHPAVPVSAHEYGCQHPGEDVNITEYYNSQFPIGTRITFQYRELTLDGIPKEARYWRKRELV